MNDSERDELLIRMDENVKSLKSVVHGNGQAGLVQRVESLETSRGWLWGFGAAGSAIASVAEWLIHRK